MDSSVDPTCPKGAPQEATNYDELMMQHSLDFAESLKDLKNLQRQLYSAAEYFEVSYNKDDHKQLVIETFKEYATKALVSTVDHLGSVASKFNGFLEEKANEVSAAKLRFSCLEQRLQTCQKLIDISGHSQQSLILRTPQHQKRYMMISAGKFVNADDFSEAVHKNNILSPRRNLPRSKQAFQATRSVSLPLPRKSNSGSSSTESSPSPSTFTFTVTATNKEQGKRSVSPFRYALKRSGSVIIRSNPPNSSRAPSEPRRSVITGVNPQRRNEPELELYSKKSKHLLKSLLSIHRTKKEGAPSRFRDDR